MSSLTLSPAPDSGESTPTAPVEAASAPSPATPAIAGAKENANPYAGGETSRPSATKHSTKRGSKPAPWRVIVPNAVPVVQVDEAVKVLAGFLFSNGATEIVALPAGAAVVDSPGNAPLDLDLGTWLFVNFGQPADGEIASQFVQLIHKSKGQDAEQLDVAPRPDEGA